MRKLQAQRICSMQAGTELLRQERGLRPWREASPPEGRSLVQRRSQQCGAVSMRTWGQCCLANTQHEAGGHPKQGRGESPAHRSQGALRKQNKEVFRSPRGCPRYRGRGCPAPSWQGNGEPQALQRCQSPHIDTQFQSPRVVPVVLANMHTRWTLPCHQTQGLPILQLCTWKMCIEGHSALSLGDVEVSYSYIKKGQHISWLQSITDNAPVGPYQ